MSNYSFENVGPVPLSKFVCDPEHGYWWHRPEKRNGWITCEHCQAPLLYGEVARDWYNAQYVITEESTLEDEPC